MSWRTLPLRAWRTLRQPGLWKAVGYTQLLAQAVGLFKVEATIRLTQHITDPFWLRIVVYGVLGVGLTALAAPLNAWLCWRLQQPKEAKS